MSSHILKFSIAALAISLSVGTNAAGYLKIEGVNGESQSTATQQSAKERNSASTGEPIGGGLDRDIIRRAADSDNQANPKRVRPGNTQSTNPRLPTGDTRLQGVEPDEID